MKNLLLAVSAVGLLALSACSSSDGEATAPREPELTDVYLVDLATDIPFTYESIYIDENAGIVCFNSYRRMGCLSANDVDANWLAQIRARAVPYGS